MLESGDLRKGLKLEFDDEPYAIVQFEFVKPGKGQAFNRVKLRNLKTGRVVEKTFKSGESVEAADVMDTDMQYLYTDGEAWYFMDPNTFEQVGADETAVGENVKWLIEQDMCEVTLWNGVPIAITPPNFVILEITETALMGELVTSLDILTRLRMKGFDLSIDDFGTGYSSLFYLKHFPVSTLKIDKSFVDDITTDASSDQIVETIIAMAQRLNLKVVAEGVEHKEQLEHLQALGCDMVQGFYFSKPLTPVEIPDFLTSFNDN